MLRVEGFAGVGRGVRGFDASQVVVYDPNGTPVFVAYLHGAQVLAARAGDPDFARVCGQLGLDVVTLVVPPGGG